MVLRFFLFAVALLFISCTDFARDNPHDPDGVNYLPSSSVDVSSSSTDVPSTNCIDPYTRECGGFCLWDNGCSKATTDPEGLYGSPVCDCETQLSNCRKYSQGRAIFSDSSCKTKID